MELKDVAETLEKMDTASQQAIKDINEKIELLSKGGITADEIKSFKDTLTKNADDIKAVNDFAEALQKQFGGKTAVQKSETFNDMIEKMVSKNHPEIVGNMGKKTPLEFDAKDYMSHKDMSFAGNTTGIISAVDFDPRIYGQPFEIPHFRNYIRIGSTSLPSYSFIRGTRKPGFAPGVGVLPGALKPEMQYQFDPTVVQVIKIAGHVRLPEEMLEDIEGTTSYLQNYMPEDILRAEDTQILYGPGTTGTLNGIYTQATVYVPSAGVVATENWDILADAQAQQMNIWEPANRVFINAIDWMFLVTRKSTDGIYSHPTLMTGANLSVNGMPITPHPLITVDTFLMGNFNNAELKVKKGLSVRWYDQDQDNAVKNMVTIVAEERVTLAVYYPESFKKGDFGRIS